jgi:hypothetical protein
MVESDKRSIDASVPSYRDTPVRHAADDAGTAIERNVDLLAIRRIRQRFVFAARNKTRHAIFELKCNIVFHDLLLNRCG